MQIKIGKYLIDIKRSYAGSQDKPPELTENKSIA